MARNGSGNFSSTVNFTTEAAAPPIEIARLDEAITDIGGEITNSIAADGQTNPTANLPMNAFKHTNVANAAARNEYASAADVQDQDLVYFVDSGAANAYVITPAPAITSYEEGQRFVFRATNANTGASTLNVNGLGTRAIQTADGVALSSGAIVDGGLYEVVYDASTSPDRWELTSMPSEVPDTMLSSNVLLKDQTSTITGTITVSSNAPQLRLNEADASADNRLWRIQASSEGLQLQAVDDAVSSVSNILAVTRTGLTIDSINLTATSGLVNGVEICTEGRTLSAGNGLTGGGDLSADRSFNIGSGTGITVNADSIETDDSAIVHDDLSGFVADEHIAHSGVTLTAGAGLTGGGTIAASRSFEVGSGDGIRINANDVALDTQALATVAGSGIAATDRFPFYDASAGLHRALEYQEAGLPNVSGSAAKTFVDADVNRVHRLTGSTDRAFTLNTGVGVETNIIVLIQEGTGSIEINGTATVNSAAGLFTRAQYSVAMLYCTSANNWIMFGDTATS